MCFIPMHFGNTNPTVFQSHQGSASELPPSTITILLLKTNNTSDATADSDDLHILYLSQPGKSGTKKVDEISLTGILEFF
uniref:Uncharacterized protein n=1 Tax=Candidatus Kentrum sp. FW TaxID=2126338 RepID=A0A450T1L9_9GAMM|nr:MAG: hypothetical protein BECKFW1821A_GA0114235_11003 [Candidatus Kentron sp. FW]